MIWKAGNAFSSLEMSQLRTPFYEEFGEVSSQII